MKTFVQQEENQKQAMLQGKSKDEKYNVLIYLMMEEDQTKGTVSYTEKKGEWGELNPQHLDHKAIFFI